MGTFGNLSRTPVCGSYAPVCASYARKVWATLRRDGLHVSHKRVWALMDAHGLVLAAERAPGR